MPVTENTTTTNSVTVTTRTGTATAQVSPSGSAGDAIHAAGTVAVDETEVSIDVVVTDPAGGTAVQGEGAGEPGRSPLETDGLPISALAD